MVLWQGLLDTHSALSLRFLCLLLLFFSFFSLLRFFSFRDLLSFPVSFAAARS
jgi:hypothetical protein